MITHFQLRRIPHNHGGRGKQSIPGVPHPASLSLDPAPIPNHHIDDQLHHLFVQNGLCPHLPDPMLHPTSLQSVPVYPPCLTDPHNPSPPGDDVAPWCHCPLTGFQLHGHLTTLFGDYHPTDPQQAFYWLGLAHIPSTRGGDAFRSSFTVFTRWNECHQVIKLSQAHGGKLAAFHKCHHKNANCRVRVAGNAQDHTASRASSVLVNACRTYPLLSNDHTAFHHFLAMLQMTINKGDVVGLPMDTRIIDYVPMTTSSEGEPVFNASVFRDWKNDKCRNIHKTQMDSCRFFNKLPLQLPNPPHPALINLPPAQAHASDPNTHLPTSHSTTNPPLVSAHMPAMANHHAFPPPQQPFKRQAPDHPSPTKTAKHRTSRWGPEASKPALLPTPNTSIPASSYHSSFPPLPKLNAQRIPMTLTPAQSAPSNPTSDPPTQTSTTNTRVKNAGLVHVASKESEEGQSAVFDPLEVTVEVPVTDTSTDGHPMNEKKLCRFGKKDEPAKDTTEFVGVEKSERGQWADAGPPEVDAEVPLIDSSTSGKASKGEKSCRHDEKVNPANDTIEPEVLEESNEAQPVVVGPSRVTAEVLVINTSTRGKPNEEKKSSRFGKKDEPINDANQPEATQESEEWQSADADPPKTLEVEEPPKRQGPVNDPSTPSPPATPNLPHTPQASHKSTTIKSARITPSHILPGASSQKPHLRSQTTQATPDLEGRDLAPSS